MKVLLQSFAIATAFSIGACSGAQPAEEGPAPLGKDQLRLHVVNEYDGPVEVFAIWESRTTRIRLGNVSIGREDDFRVPWVGGRLRITFNTPNSKTSFTSNALVLANEQKDVELTVTLDWRNRALLSVRNQDG